MKIFTFAVTAFVLVLPHVSVAETTPHSEQQLLQQMRQEIDHLEGQSAPAKGTTRQEVERMFGVGQPQHRPVKVLHKEAAPDDSPWRSYEFASLGALFVTYDEHWKVLHASYLDPFSTKGRASGVAVSIEEARREVEPRLAQMRRIHSEYQKRFSKATTPTQKHTPPLQPTITVTRGFVGEKPPVNRKVDSRRIKAFKSQKWLIAAYLSAVDKSVTSLLKESTIAHMTHNDWQKDLNSNPESNTVFFARLWKQIKPQDGTAWRSLTCNTYRDDGFGGTSLVPNVYIRKPARDLRFEWHIHTGNPKLDQQIKDIVIREAKQF